MRSISAAPHYQPPAKVAKMESPVIKVESSIIKEGNLKQEIQTENLDIKPEPFTPLMTQENTGCGSVISKKMSMFSDVKEEKNFTQSAKIDDDFSSCRAPLEVLKDVLADYDYMENISEEQKQELLNKAETMSELSPTCNCLPLGQPEENGPYYVHLGHADTKDNLRSMFEGRLKVSGHQLRIIKARFSGKEGKTSQDCPIAKWIIKRPNLEEKYLIVAKERLGHSCKFAFTVAAIISWDGVPRELADRAYEEIAQKTSSFGTETDRQCAANKSKTCACQGFDMNFNGASYTFGCSWTMYHNICKFCRSSPVHKFKLTHENAEEDLANICEELTNSVAPAYKQMAPESYKNMGLFDHVATDCRIGAPGNRIFSGFTCVCDFCAHAHKVRSIWKTETFSD